MSGTIPTSGGDGVNRATGDTHANNVGVTHTGDGRPVQIIDITNDHKFKLNEDALKRILYHPKIKHKKVCVFFYLFVLSFISSFK